MKSMSEISGMVSASFTNGTRLRSVIAMFIIMILSLLLILEIVLRFGMGLGDPPLLISDDTIGYVNKPGRYKRFGNDIRYNARFMRSDPIAPKSSNELRILVCGDSIVHGTSRVSQTELATVIAQRELTNRLSRQVSVLNIAACGWSPRNVLAYLDKYGTFGADLIFLVFNEEDLFEAKGPKGNVYPTIAPRLALQEAWQIAAMRWFDRNRGAAIIQRDSTVPIIEKLLALVQNQGQGVEVEVLYHPSAVEAQHETQSPSHGLLAKCTDVHAVKCIGLRDDLVQNLQKGENPWRPDGLHLTVCGQTTLAKVLVREVLGRVGGSDGKQ